MSRCTRLPVSPFCSKPSIAHSPILSSLQSVSSPRLRMGAYSSKPQTETVTEEGSNGVLSYGASAMQGWRLTQEDAHVTLLDFETDPVKCHLFAVFDGHGGAEVAQFAAQSLPTWVRKLPAFKQGDVEQALIEAFLTFDKHLTQKEVIQELKVLAGDDGEDDETEELNEAIALQEEADMPIEQLMAKYNQKVPVKAGTGLKPEAEKSSGCEPVAGSSGVAASSKVRSESEMEDKPSDEPASGESSQSVAASKSNGTTDSQKTTAPNGEAPHEAKSNGTAAELTADPVTDSQSVVNQSGVQKKEAPGEAKEEKNGESQVAKKEGKGKQKKVVIPKPKRKVNPVAAYQQFLEDVDDDEDSSEEEDEPFGPANARDEDSDDDEAPADDTSDDSEDEDEESDSSEEEGEEDQLNGIILPTRDFEEPGKDSGCTAVVALIRADTLFVANAGDSRCVVSCSGKAIEMSEDHKPEDEKELERIQRAGGKVTIDGRVNGGLNLSRALGDHTYKDNAELPLNEQMISPEPDVRQLKLTPEHEFMILACDGIWNSMTSQEVVDFVRSRLDQMKPSKVCEELFHHCLAPDTSGDGTGCDNMTAIIVTFDEHKQTHKRKMEVDDEPVTKKSKEEGEKEAQASASSS